MLKWWNKQACHPQGYLSSSLFFTHCVLPRVAEVKVFKSKGPFFLSVPLRVLAGWPLARANQQGTLGATLKKKNDKIRTLSKAWDPPPPPTLDIQK